MKHLKFLTACIALLLSITINAQSTEAATTQEAQVLAKSEAYTEAMVTELSITDENRIRTIQMLNLNYETAVEKTLAKNSSKEDEEKVLTLLDENRNRRFQGVLTPAQFEAYLNWKKSSTK